MTVVTRRRSRTPASEEAIAAARLVLLPSAQGEAMLAPLAMIVLCAAIAIGPDRLVSWVVEDVGGRRGSSPPRPAQGWIEEDGLPLE